jgi:anti-sigma factor RsiW
MTAPCNRLHTFADGELAFTERPAFHRHLGACAACQRELESVMMLDALAATFGSELRRMRPGAGVYGAPVASTD